ncbi:proline dehydrogenase family protein [Halorarius litoreus]|uniref:proline dehydrogenase family protein n=1 Tax=Halorarius litoreus TaxID=2962676 RepID=UPI0020CD4F3D|nr:proline dehydrogenase family protein [Halorarius litoreus]
MIPPIANNFVAGEDAPAALNHARALNADGVGAILNLLGEHYDERTEAVADAAAYCGLVDDIAGTDLDACISVKPSQIGLDVSESVYRENLADIVDRARERDVFVWMDMEGHTTTDTTLDAFEAEVTDYPKMGLCVQSNLKRTREDLERLVDLPGTVRLVKGAYTPPKELAYREKSEVNRRYRADLEYLFEHADHVAVGSHDPEMISHALDLHDGFGTDFEIQMLMGVRETAQFALADAGYEVNQYVPYGGKWLQYFYRRVRERKENALFALRAVVGN